MLNGTRARDSDSDDDFAREGEPKRINVDAVGAQSGHYVSLYSGDMAAARERLRSQCHPPPLRAMCPQIDRLL